MSILFTPGEIFDIAIEIERNGAAFYRKAAANTSDAAVRRELIELAAMEDGHEVTFAELKRDLVGNDSKTEWFDAESEAAMYLESFAAGQVFDITKDPNEFAGTRPSLDAVLRFALDRERDSVVFFLGVKDLAPTGDGRLKIESIISQEMAHISMLNRRLTQL